MREFFEFIISFFLDLRKLSAVLTIVLGCGLMVVWVSMESTNLIAESERLVIGGIVASLIAVSAALLFAPSRIADEAQREQPPLNSLSSNN